MARGFVAAAVLALSLNLPVCANDFVWPGWLGPDRNGWVSGFQPPKRWPDQLERRWQLEIGIGYGSPVVADGRVYQHGRDRDDEVVVCVDLESGDELWRKRHAVPFQMGGGGERHGKGPKASPALADCRLFTLSITGVLTAWDANTGDVIWRRDYSPRFEKGHPYWGATTSPLVDGNRVVVHFGTDGKGTLIAMDTATGEEVWTHGTDGPSYSSPILLDIHGVRQIVEWNQRAVVGVESETGRQLWEYPFPQENTNQNMPTPAWHNGLVLLGAENRGFRGLEPQRNGDEWTVAERWHQERVALDMSTAVINDGLVYGFSHFGRGRHFCLDPASGEVLWQGPGRSGENATFLAVPGYMISLVNDGQLQVLAARRDSFETVATYKVSEAPTWAPPVLLPDGVLVKDDRSLTRWSFSTAP